MRIGCSRLCRLGVRVRMLRLALHFCRHALVHLSEQSKCARYRLRHLAHGDVQSPDEPLFTDTGHVGACLYVPKVCPKVTSSRQALVLVAHSRRAHGKVTRPRHVSHAAGEGAGC